MQVPPGRSAAIFVLPTSTADQLGPVAGWLSTSGWAAAATRQLGRAWIVTPDGVLSVDEVRRRAAASGAGGSADGGRRARQALPTTAKTLLKDLRDAVRARRFRIDPRGPWSADDHQLAFVWQRHEVFHTAGIDLAQHLGVPSVLFVPATAVWQAEQWGVARPGWGRWLERSGEVPVLRRSTLVACGTDLVAEQVVRLGVAERRVIVTPTGVDLSLFAEPQDREATRRSLGIDDAFVIGWAGSFRPFHGLDQLVRAAAAVEGATLLLVGDGPERLPIERLAERLGVTARFTGMVAHDDLPRYLAAMDVGVVLARVGEPFHYSPLKAAEYLAAGLPLVAPDVPQLTARLEPGREARYFPTGDVAALAAVLGELAADTVGRARLASASLAAADAWSWDRQVQRVRDALHATGR